MQTKIFCAIDTGSFDEAFRLVKSLSGKGMGFKVGLEFFSSFGPEGIRKLRAVAAPGTPVFLDLKFHDIPATVVGAVRSVAALSPDFLTIHAGGGLEMMEAAVRTAPKGVNILAVTVLTSLEDKDLKSIGVEQDRSAEVVQLAKLAKKAGVAGVVCPPSEIEAVRKACGKDFILMVPGVRPKSENPKDDHKGVMTPLEALQKGADYLVIGRPITKAAKPSVAADEILKALHAA